MRFNELLGIWFFLFSLLVVGGAVVLAIWWRWRKISLAEGSPPSQRPDLPFLGGGAGQASITVRLVLVAVLGLLMSAPVSLIYDLIRERAESYQEVVRELARSWGGQQLFIGPLLSVPYTVRYQVTEEIPLSEAETLAAVRRGDSPSPRVISKEMSREKVAILLPETLNIKGELEPEFRRRGIYEMRVYTVNLAVSGTFKKPDFKSLDPQSSEVHWDRARVLVNLSDTKSFRDISPLSLAGRELKFVPGTDGSPAAPTGFSSPAGLGEGGPEELPFSFTMAAGGSRGFFLAPIAVENTIDLKSTWPHPKYCGHGLPSHRQQSENGFAATWQVPNLVRNYPQFADLPRFTPARDRSASAGHGEGSPVQSALPLAEYVVGVDLFEPVFHYSILTRAVKYAMMFIALTFLSVLIFEISSGRRAGVRLHLAQYGLIGLGLSLFYLVLLAASEQMPFLPAYLLAAGLNILMVGGYVRAALGSGRPALVISAILAALYTALFFILRLEEFALVAGTALVVLAMAALMYVTRNLGRPGGDRLTDGL